MGRKEINFFISDLEVSIKIIADETVDDTGIGKMINNNEHRADKWNKLNPFRQMHLNTT